MIAAEQDQAERVSSAAMIRCVGRRDPQRVALKAPLWPELATTVADAAHVLGGTLGRSPRHRARSRRRASNGAGIIPGPGDRAITVRGMT